MYPLASGEQSNGLWTPEAALSLITLHRGPFVISTYIVSLVLEKSHSSNACLVSEMSRAVVGGFSYSWGKPETPFALHHSYCPDHDRLCFLRPTRGVNFSVLVQTVFYTFWALVLPPWLSHKRAYWLELLLRLIRSYSSVATQWVP